MISRLSTDDEVFEIMKLAIDFFLFFCFWLIDDEGERLKNED